MEEGRAFLWLPVCFGGLLIAFGLEPGSVNIRDVFTAPDIHRKRKLHLGNAPDAARPDRVAGR